MASFFTMADHQCRLCSEGGCRDQTQVRITISEGRVAETFRVRQLQRILTIVPNGPASGFGFDLGGRSLPRYKDPWKARKRIFQYFPQILLADGLRIIDLEMVFLDYYGPKRAAMVL